MQFKDISFFPFTFKAQVGTRFGVDLDFFAVYFYKKAFVCPMRHPHLQVKLALALNSQAGFVFPGIGGILCNRNLALFPV